MPAFFVNTVGSGLRDKVPTVLRRIDWRFLLPRPAAGQFEHMVLLGASPQTVEAVRLAGIAKVTSGDVGTSATADLVIVLNSATGLLENAMDVVAPGGVLYCEVDRSQHRTLTPARVARRLTRAGLQLCAAHWVIPGFDPALRFVPLDHKGATRWFLRDVYQRPSMSRTTASLLARAAVAFGSAPSAVLARCFSVTAVRGPAGESVSPPATQPFDWIDLPHGWKVALVTSGQDDGSRVVVLPFAPSHAVPDRAIKITRHPQYNDRTIAEHQTLGRLRERVGPDVAASLPTPLSLTTRDGLVVASESFAKGPTVLVNSGRRAATTGGRVSDLRRISEWLTAFNRATVVRTITWSAAEQRHWLERPIEKFRAAFGTSDARERLFAETLSWSRRCDGHTLPIVITHNDLGPWNVHRDGTGLTVIDWEFDSSPDDREGLPMTDLVYFVTHWLYAARRLRRDNQQIDAFRRLIGSASKDVLTSEAWNTFAVHANRSAIDPRFIPLLMVLAWIERANDRCGRSDNVADDAAASRYVRYVDLIAERGLAFFEGSSGA